MNGPLPSAATSREQTEAAAPRPPPAGGRLSAGAALTWAAGVTAAAMAVVRAVPADVRESTGIAVAVAVSLVAAVFVGNRLRRPGLRALWALVLLSLLCNAAGDVTNLRAHLLTGGFPEMNVADLFFWSAIVFSCAAMWALARDSVQRGAARLRTVAWDVPSLVLTYALPTGAFAVPWILRATVGLGHERVFDFAYFTLYLLLAVAVQLVVYAEGRLAGIRLPLVVGYLAMLCAVIVTAIHFVLWAWFPLWIFGCAAVGLAARVAPENPPLRGPDRRVQVMPFVLTTMLGVPIVFSAVILTSGLQRVALIAGFAFVALSGGRLALRLLRSLRTVSEELADRNEELSRRVGELEEARDELRRLARAKDDFAATVVHELRTPATVITGFARTIRQRRGELDAEDADELLARIEVVGSRLGRLVEDLRELIGDEVGTLRVEPEPVDFGGLVEEIEAMFPQLAPAHRLEVDVRGEPVRGTFYADSGRLTQVLRNLIENAAKFGPPGSTIRLEVRTTAETVEIAVVDEGPGVPEDLGDRVFDPFVTAGGGAGSGLGLAVSRNIVRAHGGTIGVENVAPHGARFWVRLPRVAPLGRRAEEAGERAAPGCVPAVS